MSKLCIAVVLLVLFAVFAILSVICIQASFKEIKEARFCFSEQCISEFTRHVFASAYAFIMSVILFLISMLCIIKLLEIDACESVKI